MGTMNRNGFTLLELIATLGILTALMMISYPFMTHHLVTARRKQAEAALINLAGRLDEYYSLEGRYKTASAEILHLSELNRSQYYRLIIQAASDDRFTISAVPLRTQAREDKQCGTLTLDEMGNRRISGDGDIKHCWS